MQKRTSAADASGALALPAGTPASRTRSSSERVSRDSSAGRADPLPSFC